MFEMLFLIVVLVAVYLISNKQYKETSYYKITNTPLLALRSDVGKYGELVLITAKRGENKGNLFYGCSNYPKCKYIQEYTPQ